MKRKTTRTEANRLGPLRINQEACPGSFEKVLWETCYTVRCPSCSGLFKPHSIDRDESKAVVPRHNKPVARASAGAIAHLPIAKVTNLVRAMEELKEAGYWLRGKKAGDEEKKT